MPAATATIIGAIGVAASIASTIGGMSAASASASAARRAEALREKAMNLDASRRKREVIRQQEIQRAQALSTATSQGAEGGSVLEGAYGSISGAGGRASLGIEQNREIGAGIFAANRDAAKASESASMWSGLGSLAGIAIKNAGTFDRVGQYYGINRQDDSGMATKLWN